MLFRSQAEPQRVRPLSSKDIIKSVEAESFKTKPTLFPLTYKSIGSTADYYFGKAFGEPREREYKAYDEELGIGDGGFRVGRLQGFILSKTGVIDVSTEKELLIAQTKKDPMKVFTDKEFATRLIRGRETKEGSLLLGAGAFRSEERRVGKECRSRWSPYH